MKNTIIFFFCFCTVLLVLFLRSVVHEHVDTKYTSAFNGEDSGKDVLQLHFHERRPYYVKYKENVYGLIANPVAKTLKQAEIDFEWVETPAQRQLDIIRENSSATCAIGWVKTPQRQRFAQFTLPVYQDESFVAVTRADNILLQPEESFDRVFSEGRLKLLVKSGYSYGSFIDQKLDEKKIWMLTTTGDNQSMLEMILELRADYCFMSEEEAYDLLIYSSLNNTDFKIIHFRDIPEGNKRYLICSRKVKKGMIDRMNQAIKHFIKISDNRK